MDLRSGRQLGEEEQSDEDTTMSQESREMEKRSEMACLLDMFRKMEGDRKMDKKAEEEKEKRREQAEEERRQAEEKRRAEEKEQEKKERREEFKQLDEGRKQDLKQIVQIIDEKVRDLKEEIRRDTQAWKSELRQEIEKNEQDVATLVVKTVALEEKVEKNEQEISNMANNVSKNTREIEEVKKQVNAGLIDKTGEDRIGNAQQIEEIRKELKIISENRNREVDVVTRIVCHGESKLHKFTGNVNKLHPQIFLKSIKRKLTEEGRRAASESQFERSKEIIRENLEYDALVWFNGIENDLEEFEQFETRFLAHFWGDNVQATLRERLYFGKYNQNLTSTMTSYAMKLYSTAQYLTPKIAESELVMYISRQFKPEISETIAVHNISTMEQMYAYLDRVERNMPRAPQNTNYNRNFQNSSNHTCNNSNRNFNRTNQGNQNNFNNFRQNYNNSRLNNNNNNSNFRNHNYNNHNNGRRYMDNNFSNNRSNYNNFNDNNNLQRNQNFNNNNNNSRQFNNRYTNNNNNNVGSRLDNNNFRQNSRWDQQPPWRDTGQPRRQVNAQMCRHSSRSEERYESNGGSDEGLSTRRTQSLDRAPEL